MPDTTLSTAARGDRPAAAGRERTLRAGIGALAATTLATGLWMTVAPESFRDAIGPFGPYNEHFVRDVATWTLAYGFVLAAAVGTPSWRVPALAFGIAQGALHFVNHLIDVGEADPGWVGAFDAVAIAALAGVTWWLLVLAREQAGASAPRSTPGAEAGR